MEDDNSNVGFRFHPKDFELVDYFLRHKMLGNDSKVSRIGELNITDFEPWELPAKSVVRSDDQEWYFFCPRKPKYSIGRRSQRNTKTGQWKITGKERKVKRRGTNVVIGTKKTLVFYKGRAGSGPAPTRTNWVMHEYSALNPNDSCLKPYVLCLVKKKMGENDIPTHDEAERRCYEAEPSHTPITLFNSGDESSIPEFYEHQEPDMDSLFEHQEPDMDSLFEEPDFSDLQLLMQEEQGPPNVEHNDYNGLQFQSDVRDEEDDTDFLNSVIVDGHIQAESLMREYGDRDLFSSDTDVEVFQPRYRQILEGLSNELEYTLTARGSNVSESSAAVFGGRCQSSTSIRPIRKGVQSVNRSTLPIKEGFIRGKESDAESSNLVKKGVSNVKRGKESGAESSNLVKKGVSNVKPETDSEVDQEMEEKVTLKSRFIKASFIVMEAPFKASSPSVYFVNAVVGAVLFLAMVWEMVLIGGQ